VHSKTNGQVQGGSLSLMSLSHDVVTLHTRFKGLSDIKADKIKVRRMICVDNEWTRFFMSRVGSGR
jgi:hypothetical protein